MGFMRLWIAALICWLAAAPVLAEDPVYRVRLETGELFEIVKPPARYRQMPYLAPVKVEFLSAAELERSCSVAIGRMEGFGCTILAAPVFCTILINVDLKRLYQHVVLAHEDAHCRGWPGDHPAD